MSSIKRRRISLEPSRNAQPWETARKNGAAAFSIRHILAIHENQ